jgi:hypothetical protein
LHWSKATYAPDTSRHHISSFIHSLFTGNGPDRPFHAEKKIFKKEGKEKWKQKERTTTRKRKRVLAVQ